MESGAKEGRIRILGLTDITQFKERIDKGIKDTYPKAEARNLQWPPDNIIALQVTLSLLETTLFCFVL